MSGVLLKGFKVSHWGGGSLARFQLLKWGKLHLGYSKRNNFRSRWLTPLQNQPTKSTWVKDELHRYGCVQQLLWYLQYLQTL